MNRFGAIWKLVGILGISGLTLGGMTDGPSASFDVSPGRPSARSEVRFVDHSAGAAATSWLWMFGDGYTSTQQNPSHVYQSAGFYPVTLRVNDGSRATETTTMVQVAPEDTLVLLSQDGHPFDVTLEAVNPDPSNGLPLTEQALAKPQNDVFGFFTFPVLVPTAPGAPFVPEVFVKILDARAIGQDFWVFWGGLTSLEYTLTVTDRQRGTSKQYHNPATGNPGCLGADTSGFVNVPTPTPTQSGGSPTPTATPTPTASQTHEVGINSDFFRDQTSGTSTTTVNVGDKVEWQWNSGFHSTTSGPCPPCTPDGGWDSGAKSSGSFQHTFVEADRGRTIAYYCNQHFTMMKGTIIVNP